MSSVSVITVNYNHSDVTGALLHSIAEKDPYPDLEIIVVDNGSANNPVPAWQKKYPGVTFLRSEENLGFAGGNNLGIKASKGDYLFLVNNDTEFTPNLVEELVATMDSHPEIGIISPKIRYYDQPDTLQFAGFSNMNFYTARTAAFGQFEKDNGQYNDHTGETGFIHGAAMMVRREAMSKAGMMAENYFLYYEEMDWCERIRRAGYKIWINMQALIYHKESVSVGSNSALKEYFMNRNRILFIRRNGSFSQKLVFWPYFIFVVTPRNLLRYMKEKKPGYIGVLFRAITWNITNGTESKKLGFDLKKRK
jgi:GT2 family glycosyltransferase